MSPASTPQEPSAVELLLPQVRVDLPKTTRIQREGLDTFLGSSARAQSHLDAFQSIGRSARSIGFVKVRHLTIDGDLQVETTPAGIALTEQPAAEPHTSPDI